MTAAPDRPDTAAEVGEVEAVARAIWDVAMAPHPWPSGSGAWSQHERDYYRAMARAALAARRPATEAEQAVERVRALADEWEADAKRHDDAEPVSTDGLTRMILAARHCREHAARIRAALDPS